MSRLHRIGRTGVLPRLPSSRPAEPLYKLGYIGTELTDSGASGSERPRGQSAQTRPSGGRSDRCSPTGWRSWGTVPIAGARRISRRTGPRAPGARGVALARRRSRSAAQSRGLRAPDRRRGLRASDGRPADRSAPKRRCLLGTAGSSDNRPVTIRRAELWGSRARSARVGPPLLPTCRRPPSPGESPPRGAAGAGLSAATASSTVLPQATARCAPVGSSATGASSSAGRNAGSGSCPARRARWRRS